jgi:myosin heavy subunit
LGCERCEEFTGNVEFLEQQLNDAHITQETLKQKLAKTKFTLATTIERESKIRDAKESLELEEAQIRYEFEELRSTLLKELDVRDHEHSEKVKSMEKAMNAKECDWENKNQMLQKELRDTLRSALEDTESEEHSLTSLEQEIDSLRTVIDLRSSENKELRSINEQMNEKIEHQSWLEAELEKAKRRLEELTLIVQNKMVSERELLELSEALQRDLVQSRTETLHYKQQIENRQYLQEHNEKNLQLLHKVKHSQSDLYNNQVPILAQNASIGSVPSNVIPSNIINNDISKQSLFLSDKTSNLQKLTNWVKEDEDEKSNNKNLEDNWPSSHNIDNNNPQLEQRNQHQKARCSAWFAFAF